MEIALFVVYIVLLLLALGYGGVIIYHMLKYRTQLPDKDAHRAVVTAVGYAVVGGGVILLSIFMAIISGLMI